MDLRKRQEMDTETFVFVAAVHLCQNFFDIIYYHFFISVLSGTRLKPYHFFLLSNIIFLDLYPTSNRELVYMQLASICYSTDKIMSLDCGGCCCKWLVESLSLFNVICI